jgi:molybdopterin converting factor small subunit
MLTIEVRFFGRLEDFTRRAPAAVLRDLPRVQLPVGATVDYLLRLLSIPTGQGRPLVSVNGFYQRDDAPLAEGDRVQLLRTVVGG